MDGHAPPPDKSDAPASVGIHEAKTNLSKLVARAEAGEEIVIKRGGVPVAKLVAAAPRKRRLGLLEGQIHMADDFDDLPDEFLGYGNDD